jgi:hypothetical protein
MRLQPGQARQDEAVADFEAVGAKDGEVVVEHHRQRVSAATRQGCSTP